MHLSRPTSGRWRGLFTGLAGLALAIQVLLPPGFMFAGSTASPLSVVICTGHGPLLRRQGLVGPFRAPPAKSKAGAPCTLAAHLGGAAPLASATTPVAWVWTPIAAPAHRPAVFVGRGLTAPPPARAPPAAPI